MKLNILTVMLAAAALASANTGEFMVDPGVVYAPADQNQLYPAAASNGTNSLIVWADERGGSGSDIYGTRFIGESPSGTVLDPAGLVVSAAASSQKVPAVCSDGIDYLVAWTDLRADSGDIYVCRVTSDGSVLDPEGIPVSTVSGYQGEPAIAFDGTNYLVVWSDLRDGGADIYGARVTRDAGVLDPSGIALLNDSADQTAPAVCYDGSNVLLVWADTRNSPYGDIYGARIDSEGALLDSAGFPISLAQDWQGSPAVAPGVDEALVVWEDRRSGPTTDIYGSRVSHDGAVLDSAGFAIATSSWYEFDAKVTFDGTQYLVVWTDAIAHGNVLGGRVATDGTVVDGAGFYISRGGEYAGSPTVAFDGTYNVVAWSDVRVGMADYSVSEARVDRDGNVLDPMGIPVSNAASSQRLPVAAFGGTEFLVAWGESRTGISDIYGIRLTPEGTAADSTAIRISPSSDAQAVAAAAYGGSNFLVVWEQGRLRERDVCGARVGHDGVVLDTAGIQISGSPWEQCVPEVGSDGADFLVAWQDWRNSSYDIYCARVSRTGIVLDTAGVAVSTSSGDQVTPAVAYDGTNYLVLWQVRSVSARDIYGARISRQGVLLDPDGFVVSAGADAKEQPDAASDGDGCLVVWSDWRNGDRDIYGARVARDGTVLDPEGIEICRAPGTQDCPAVEYDGTDFLVVWQDQRDGERDLCGARVTRQGTVLDTFPSVTQQGYQVNPILTRGSGSKMLLTYGGWTGIVDDVPYNSPRIWGTLSQAGGTSDRPADAAHPIRYAKSIVRGVLALGAAGSGRDTGCRTELLDVGGRKVFDLRTGPNDVRTLAPGVYFIREAPQAASRNQQAARKIVITK